MHQKPVRYSWVCWERWEGGGGIGEVGGQKTNVISLAHVTVRILVYQKQIFIHFIPCQSLSHVEDALPVKTEA